MPCRSYAHLSEDERDQIGVFAGRWAVDGGHCRGARSGEKLPSPGSSSKETHSLWAEYSPLLTPPEPINCARRREAILKREAALRLFVGDRLAEGWTPEQISGWLEIRERTAAAEPSAAVRQSTASSIGPQKAAAPCGVIYDASPQTPSPASRQGLARRHQGSKRRIHDRPEEAIEGRGEAGHWEGDLIICKRTRPVLVLHERKSRVLLPGARSRSDYRISFKSLARRSLELHNEIADLDAMIGAIVPTNLAPNLVARNSIGQTGPAASPHGRRQPRALALGGQFCSPMWRQSRPGLVRKNRQASSQSRRRSRR